MNRLRTVFRKRAFGVCDRHVFECKTHGACVGNMHRRRDRVCGPGELVRKCQFCLGTNLVFLGNVYRLRTVFRKCEFSVSDKHVFECRIHWACVGNVHRRRDRVCDPGELVRFFGNVSFAKRLSLFSLQMCTGFERFLGNVSLALATSMFSWSDFRGRVLKTCTGAVIVSA